MLSVADVATLLQREGSGVSAEDYDETAQPNDARQRRAELLRPVLASCEQARFAPSGNIDLIAEKLGDGSRDAAWRLPFGDSGILNFFLQQIAMGGMRQGLHIHALRIIGNSCADTDENRARVVEGDFLAPIIRDLDMESLIPFSIPVLFNILVDYGEQQLRLQGCRKRRANMCAEPAQRLASQSRLSHKLTLLLSSPRISEYSPFINYFCKILALLVAQEGEVELAHPSTVPVLLTLAATSPYNDDIEDFITLASVAMAYLAPESSQNRLISAGQVSLLLNVYYHAHVNVAVDHIDDPDLVNQLRQLQTSLLSTLADLTASDAFFTRYPLQGPVSQTFWAWLRAPNARLQTASCLALGNYSRSDELSYALVHTHGAHIPVIELLSNPEINDAQVLHAAISFLKNLAIPANNKPSLGDLLEPSCVPRIYAFDSQPHVQFAAVSLTRLLLVNCPSNVRRICKPLSSDPSSPAHERTNVHALVSLFERSDAEPTRLEASRSIAAICRVLHSNPAAPILPDWDPSNSSLQSSAHTSDNTLLSSVSSDYSEDSKRRDFFYKRHYLENALAFLVAQTKWPILRSEAWFVFALMCRSRDGAASVLTMFHVQAAMDSLIEAVTGRRSFQPAERQIEPGQSSSLLSTAGDLELEPQQVDASQKANMAKVDRENAVVLCTEILRNWGDELPPLRLGALQDLIKQGTELIAAEKR
ncbi:hypothetical protein S40285_04938 [Stachybotrys chlorohalonatus IBT 40285]|uniref:Uncharacterized protein n=1 Tax=Stachybotrys chlorohalonatus (strain IBT 40285) TaxID=1283841 RepID=A0A084QUI4_STAC4|nr:hypothetical protein S40285_04938 [Stachybotrys chlorohalonata IBT 40285]